MFESVPPMIRQAEIISEMAAELRAAAGPGIEVSYTVAAVGRTTRFWMEVGPKGQARRVFPPSVVDDLADELREVMYSNDVGTWFTMNLRITAGGQVATTFDYDSEPDSSTFFGPAEYALDQQTFPRDVEHQPAWLRAKIAEGTAALGPQVNAWRTADGLVVESARAWDVLATEVETSGNADEPRFAVLFDEGPVYTDAQIEQLYRDLFPVVFPGVVVTESSTLPREVARLTLTGPAALLDELAGRGW